MSTPTTKIGQSPQNASGKKWLIPTLLGLVGTLLFSNLYTLNRYSQKSQTVDSSTALLDKMHKDSLELQVSYMTAMDSLNQKKSENTELNAYIENMKGDLTKIYKEIGLKVKAGVNDETLSKELNRLTTKMRDNLNEIEALRKDKAALQQRIVEVQKEKDSETKQKLTAINERDVTDSLKKVTEANLAAVTAAAAATAAEKVAAEEKVAALKKQITEASFVAIPIVKVSPQSQGRKSASETEKAKKVDFYKVCFTTAVNPLVKKGNQKFYLRLMAPEGVPIQFADAETTADGKPVRFVQLVEVEYDGSAKETCPTFTLKEKLKAGKYGLDIFNNDKLVGQTSFTLK